MGFELYPALATCLALLVYAWNFANCGRAREKYGVKAPAVTGNEVFERFLRIQQNMVEQLIVFLPSLWIFSLLVSAFWGGIVGLVFVVGRVIYSAAYASDPAKRSTGFIISGISNAALLLGATGGVIWHLIAGGF